MEIRSPRTRMSRQWLSGIIALILVVPICLLTGWDWQAGLCITLLLAFTLLAIIDLEYGVYAIVVFTMICIDGWTPSRSPDAVVFRLAVGHLYITELAIYMLAFIYLLKRTFGVMNGGARLRIVSTALDAPLKLFAILMPAFAFYGLTLGNAAQDAFGYDEWRSLFMAIVFYFLVISIVTSIAQALRLAWWFMGVCTAAGIYSLLAYWIGAQGSMAFVFGSGPHYEGPVNYMFVFAALVSISLLMFWPVHSMGRRILIILAALIPTINVLVSEKRDPQLVLMIGLAVLAWRVPLKSKLKWGLSIGCMVLLAIVSIQIVGIRTNDAGITKSASRYSEVTELIQNPQKLAMQGNETILFHLMDLVDSFNSIRQRPILGYGFGGQFVRRYTSLSFVGGESIQPGIVHDQYLDFWLKMGFLGLFAFLWLLVRFFRFGHAVIPRRPNTARAAIALGFYAAMWGDLAAEIWQPNWIGSTKMPILFLISFALVVLLLQKETDFGVAP